MASPGFATFETAKTQRAQRPRKGLYEFHEMNILAVVFALFASLRLQQGRIRYPSSATELRFKGETFGRFQIHYRQRMLTNSLMG